MVKKKTQKIENYLSPITITIYKCTNKTCQSEIDKKIKQNAAIQKEQQLAKNNSLKKKTGISLKTGKKNLN